MIKFTLNWLDLISIEKETWRTATIDKADCTLSIVYSLLKINRKTYIIWKYPSNSLKYVVSTYLFGYRGIFRWFYFDSFELLWSGRKNHVGKKVPTWYIDFAECRRELERLGTQKLYLLFKLFLSFTEMHNCAWYLWTCPYIYIYIIYIYIYI